MHTLCTPRIAVGIYNGGFKTKKQKTDKKSKIGQQPRLATSCKGRTVNIVRFKASYWKHFVTTEKSSPPLPAHQGPIQSPNQL